LNAIAMADQLIGYGEFDVVVAGEMESMTRTRAASRHPPTATPA
jgi:acetyl-CoA acetyltransferase